MLQARKCANWSRTLLRYDGGGRDLWMGGRRKAGAFGFCRMCVDPHQRGADKLANIQSGNGGVFEATFDVQYDMHELGLCGHLMITNGCLQAQLPSVRKR